MGETKIEWTERTWNPIRGCSRVSAGCQNCYAERMAARFSDEGMPYEGLAKRNPARWTGDVRLVEEHLEDPLKWRKPRRVFVNSMSDLFHERLPMNDIVRVFKVMSEAPRHTFQVLTKRPGRMWDFMMIMSRFNEVCERPEEWPLKNVWLGVSVEDQKTADERIPLLLNTPAAVRFISAEPLLGPLDLGAVRVGCGWRAIYCGCSPNSGCGHSTLDWVITGGESGPGARPCQLDWLRNVVTDCREAGVPCFVKQLGGKFAVNYYDHDYREEYEAQGFDWPEPMEWETRHGQPPVGSRVRIQLKDRKGGDPSEWPEDLRVRQFPALTQTAGA